MIPPTNPSWTPLNLEADPQITVVLVEPRIPQNAGNIARLCACTGADLYLVGSLGFQLGEKKYDKYLKRAGMDYLDDLPMRHVPEFHNVLEEKPGWTPYFVSTKATRHYADIAYPDKTMLVFGSETHGLPAWLITENPETSIRIPMRADARSLNLANSVAIVLYETVRQRQMQPLAAT
jgi:tRNA (cytidine/uridine-2'-O-)-methyltransferase